MPLIIYRAADDLSVGGLVNRMAGSLTNYRVPATAMTHATNINTATNRSTECEPVTLFLGGDVMTGRGIDQRLPYSVDPVLHEWYAKSAEQYVKLTEKHSGALPETISHEHVWGDALNELQQANPDLRIINLETAITTRNSPWPRKGIHYRMHPGNTALLTAAGIDVCVLGNNHVLDWGRAGLTETLRTLQDHGLAATGAGWDDDSAARPAVIKTKKGRLLVFSYASPCSGTPADWEAKKQQPGVNYLNNLGPSAIKKVVHDVTAHRIQDDRVVVSLHWGGNWGYEVPPSQRNFARRLVDAGAADLIHGHSSHHPKSIEVYNDRLILYGCGDLINDYEGISGYEDYRDDLPLLYFPKLDENGRLTSLLMRPLWIHRFRLNRAADEDIEWLAERLNRECQKFGCRIERTADNYLKLSWEK